MNSMLGFADWIKRNTPCDLSERALNIGNRSVAYPRFDNVLIIAGGAGSGKDFVLNNMINFTGKEFNVDDIKRYAIHMSSQQVIDQFYKKYGFHLNHLDLFDPEETAALHDFVSEKGWDTKVQRAFFLAAAQRSHKDNVIFNVTLKNATKIKTIGNLCDIGGYKKTNRHVVWVLTNFNEATKNNQTRARRVPTSIMQQSHRGVSKTLRELVENNDRSVIDGDVYIIFNMRGADSDVTITSKGVPVINRYTCYQIKKAGHPFESIEKIQKEIGDKLNSYVPDSVHW